MTWKDSNGTTEATVPVTRTVTVVGPRSTATVVPDSRCGATFASWSVATARPAAAVDR